MKWLKEQHQMFKELLEACKEQLKNNPDDIELIQLRGTLYNWEQSYDEAIRDLNIVIDNSPENENAYLMRGDCYCHTGQYDLAKQDYLRAMKLQFHDDEEFVKGHTEEVISTSTIANEEELANIKRVLELEKERILLSIKVKG